MAEAFSFITDTIRQLHTMLPDSALFGSIVMYLLTLNKSFGVLALFIVELMQFHKFIAWLQYGTTDIPGPSNIQCTAGYKRVSMRLNRVIPANQYPSYGLFSLTAIGTYLGLSTYEFSDTIKSMGKEWNGREELAYVFITLVILLAIIGRLVYCDSGIEILIAVVAAIICGGLFFKINVMLFGKEGVNFLGLPVLESKVKAGENIYICNVSNDPVTCPRQQ
jgi:hypothetical protein